MAGDDEFEPRLGRPHDRGGSVVSKARSFSAEVTAAARRSGLGALGARYGGRGRSFGRGRGGASSAAGRRVTIKARIVRHRGARFRAASLGTHLYYLRRGGTGRDGRAADAFDRDGIADHDAFAARAEPDRHHFRFIVSPEDADQLGDLRSTTRDLMAQMERDLGTKLDWIAVDHWNTDNPHVHLLVRGVAEDGQDLVIGRDYISRGLRARAENLVSRELGPRTALEIGAAADREVVAERWTGLDRTLRGRVNEGGLIDLRPVDGVDPDQRRRLIGRVQVLQRFGLSTETAPGRWTIVADLELRLREIALRNDIIKSMHAALGASERDPAAMIIEGDAIERAVVGKVLARGLQDELNGQAFVLVDGIDGRLHHFRFGGLDEAGDTPVGGLVEVRERRVDDQQAGLRLHHRSDLSIEAQVDAKGATWLDRQLVAREPSALAATGFGAEVRQALEGRRRHLVSAGLASQTDGGFKPSSKLIEALRQEELDRVAARYAGEGGRFNPSGEGEGVSGVYARRLDLVSGRFAMIEDGLGFQLVPWTRTLDGRLGQMVSGTVTKGGVEWSLGKKRGLGL